MRKKIILINGPAGVGKDTAADFIVRRHVGHATKMKFAQPLKEAVHALFGIEDTPEQVDRNGMKAFVVPGFEDYKSLYFALDEKPLSLRKAYIDMSEVFAKRYNPKHFGRLAAKRVARSPSSLIVFSDSGFDYEIEPVVEWAGPKNTLLIRLHRNGYTYDGDNRSYVSLSHLGVKELDIQNVDQFDDVVTNLKMFDEVVNRSVEKWLND